ncbi:hypothetical protein PCE1_003206 [Barthelona sp. PCE]
MKWFTLAPPQSVLRSSREALSYINSDNPKQIFQGLLALQFMNESKTKVCFSIGKMKSILTNLFDREEVCSSFVRCAVLHVVNSYHRHCGPKDYYSLLNFALPLVVDAMSEEHPTFFKLICLTLSHYPKAPRHIETLLMRLISLTIEADMISNTVLLLTTYSRLFNKHSTLVTMGLQCCELVGLSDERNPLFHVLSPQYGLDLDEQIKSQPLKMLKIIMDTLNVSYMQKFIRSIDPISYSILHLLAGQRYEKSLSYFVPFLEEHAHRLLPFASDLCAIFEKMMIFTYHHATVICFYPFNTLMRKFTSLFSPETNKNISIYENVDLKKILDVLISVDCDFDENILRHLALESYSSDKKSALLASKYLLSMRRSAFSAMLHADIYGALQPHSMNNIGVVHTVAPHFMSVESPFITIEGTPQQQFMEPHVENNVVIPPVSAFLEQPAENNEEMMEETSTTPVLTSGTSSFTTKQFTITPQPRITLEWETERESSKIQEVLTVPPGSSPSTPEMTALALSRHPKVTNAHPLSQTEVETEEEREIEPKNEGMIPIENEVMVDAEPRDVITTPVTKKTKSSTFDLSTSQKDFFDRFKQKMKKE